jgi:hypothetical protein
MRSTSALGGVKQNFAEYHHLASKGIVRPLLAYRLDALRLTVAGCACAKRSAMML